MTLSAVSLSLVLTLTLGFTSLGLAGETLSPLKDGTPPQTLEELWAGFDPRADSIEEQIVKEWEEDGVYVSIVRYCIGTFKGEKSWMAAYYARPLKGENLPGLVQVHGGGQAASREKVIVDAKRGYACISINWGGNRFYKEEDLGPDAQTYWGNIDGSQQKIQKDIDPVESLRNDKYFVRTLAARRALTFLENREEVDPEKLGMYGFSMGGNITIRVAGIDDRVKVAAPMCATPIDKVEGTFDYIMEGRMPYETGITCPIIYPTAANDFYGHIEDIDWLISRMPSKQFAMVREPHFSHKGTVNYGQGMPLWFDAHLKEDFKYPANPTLTMDVSGESARPTVKIKVDDSLPVEMVDIYYTRDGMENGFRDVRFRFWEFSAAVKNGDSYEAGVDIYGTDKPLWIYANVHYKLPENVANRSDRKIPNLVTSSLLLKIQPGDLTHLASASEKLPKTKLIQSFEDPI